MKRWSRWSSKGRSPTMRHVSRTDRVALDWLFDRINQGPKIQIKYVDTKNQLADILTKGNFTRDEWNHLLRLFNISIFSSASCPPTMSKRIQEGTREEIIMEKSRPTSNLVSKTVASSSTAQSSSASNCPGILKAPSQSLSHKSMCGETCSLRFKSKWRSVEFSSVAIRRKNERKCGETWCHRDKPELGLSSKCGWDLPQKIQTSSTTTQSGRIFTAYLALTFRAAEGSGIVDVDSVWPNNFQISVACVPHLEKFYSNLRQNFSYKSGDDMWTNSMWIRWYGECSATLDAAIHLGKDYLENLHSTKIFGIWL